MKQYIHHITTPLVFASLILVAFAGMANAVDPPAQPNSAGQALEIAPPVLSLVADPGEVIDTQISLRDVSTSSLVVTSTVNDFTAAGEDGSPKIDVDKTEPSPYSIISWVSPLPELNLKPRQIEKLPVKITVPANAVPGGYYGVVRFSAVPPDVETSGVSLSASLGALIFIRVNGDAKESMEIVEFSVNKDGDTGSFFDAAPLEFVERIKNTGTVHEQPVGTIIVKDMFGKNVVGLNVNLENRNVLPNSTRKFTTPLDKSSIGNRMLFGRYTAELTSKFGLKGQTVTKKISFWVIPWKLILGVITILAIAIVGIIYAIRRNNERLLGKSRGTRRR